MKKKKLIGSLILVFSKLLIIFIELFYRLKNLVNLFYLLRKMIKICDAFKPVNDRLKNRKI